MSEERSVVIALDIGTSSVRALGFGERGELLPGISAHVPHSPFSGADGANTFDADALFDRVVEVLDDAHVQLASQPNPANRVVAVTTDTFAGNLLGVDAGGKPLMPLLTYADTRSAAAMATLKARPDAAQIYQRVGAPFHTAYWPAQLAWLRVAQPDVWAATERWLTIGEYVLWRLTGRLTCSFSVASWTGLLDRRKLAWDDGLRAALGVEPRQLSPLGGSEQARAGLQDEFHSRWTMFRDALWFPAISDGAAANIGSGCVDESSAAVTIGSTAAVRVMVRDTPASIPPGLWCYRLDAKRSLLGGALSEGGNVIAWLRDLMGDCFPEENELGRATPAELTFLPLIAGERAPGWRADARGALAGLSLNSSAAEIAAAAMEGVALRLGRVVELIRPAAPNLQRFVASGGGLLESNYWAQTMADVLGLPLALSAEREATCRGSALLALEAMGVLSLDRVEYPVSAMIQADAARHGSMRTAGERQQCLYDNTVS